MNKEELISEISKKTKVSKKEAGMILSATIDTIQSQVKKGEKITLAGFGTFSILPMIRDAIDMPLAAAGGICDLRTTRAAFALGAEAVFCGTLFLAVKESPAADNVKEF